MSGLRPPAMDRHDDRQCIAEGAFERNCARSAARTMVSAESSEGEYEDKPMLTVTAPRGWDFPCGYSVDMILRRMRSAITPASCTVVCGRRIENSSPP